ncbi:DUF5362 family protein [Chitinophaga sp. GCM10012297]|uniref:DUF5362 domain-containing protein n=1 Tax=Chitinophaga chungangae TaxID=2821488 RepID=A0ABS3YH82_9BACT|nr:DUF5362 family protein [Chitinophaga chungangae]MBO9154052.1 hypothetical protein [Chitinophaga chungangae]
MENSNLFDLNIDAEVSGYLNETARWGKFLAILGFIGCGFMIFVALIMNFMPMGPAGFAGEGYGSGGAVTRTLVMVIYLVLGIISIFPYIYLMRFSKRVQLAIQSNDQGSLASAFSNLKSLFKYVGVLTIIMLAFFVLALIGGIFAGIMAASGSI